jgi:hypothetical protein
VEITHTTNKMLFSLKIREGQYHTHKEEAQDDDAREIW